MKTEEGVEVAVTDRADWLRSAYSRATWLALLVGVIVGAALGFVVVSIVGSGAPWGVETVSGVAGGIVAAIAAGGCLAILAGMNAYVPARSRGRIAIATITASVVTGVLSVALLWIMFLRAVLWVAGIAAVIAGIVAIALALAAEKRAPTLPAPVRRDHIPSGIALWPLGAAALTPIGAGGSIFLLRTQLHVQCGIYFEAGVSQIEANGTWVCADGISYLMPGLILLCGPVVLSIAGALVAHLIVRDRSARLVLTLLAAASVGWVLGWTSYASRESVHSTPPGVDSLHYWYVAVGPAAAVSASAVVIALIALAMRPVIARRMLGLAIAGMLIASVACLGISAGTLVAAGLLGAAYGRGPVHDDPLAPSENSVARPGQADGARIDSGD